MAPPEPRSIDIMYVSHVGVLGGAERSLLDLVSALERQRHRIRVVLPAPGEFSENLERMSIPFDFCPLLQPVRRCSSLPQQGIQAFRLFVGAVALRSLIKRYSPTIVHANSTTAALYVLCLPLQRRPPTLWHFRDLVPPSGIGRILARRCARIIAPSSCCRDAAIRIADPARVVTIPNGIHLQTGNAHDGVRSREGGCDRVLVAVVGQLVGWKGHTTAIEVARRVISCCPNANFLIIADDRFDTTGTAVRRLHEMIDKLDLAAHVTIKPYVDHVGEILARADILLHPAFPEPFGRVIIEAMAAGCPVVAYEGAHGPGEIIRHGIDGLLAARSADALASAVVRLARDPELRRRMGRAARRRTVRQYSRDLMAQRMKDLYASVAIDPQS